MLVGGWYSLPISGLFHVFDSPAWNEEAEGTGTGCIEAGMWGIFVKVGSSMSCYTYPKLLCCLI